MNVLIIPDKFKGSLTAAEAIAAIRAGLAEFDPSITTHAITASDGGDGFLEAVRGTAAAIELINCPTTDPLDRGIEAVYGYDAGKRAAYVELAKASGLECLKTEERDPLRTTSRGTGTLIADAIGRGATEVYVGLGGSATNDGGIGIASALGYRFLGRRNEPLTPRGGELEAIERIDAGQRMVGLDDVRVFAINDVANPLLGAEGAAAVYGPQKGAGLEMVEQLERGLWQLDQVVRRDLGIAAADVPGAGAAGGAGYGLKVFLRAEFLSGIEFVLSLTGIESLLAGGAIDWIITGEGRIDDQTAYGKLVRGVAEVGRKYGVPVIAICGINALERKTADDLGVRHIRQLHDDSRSIDETISNAGTLLRRTAADVLGTLRSNPEA